MLPSINNPKVTKPLSRPSSGQQKRTPGPTAPSKMEILPPEKILTNSVTKSQPKKGFSKKFWEFERLILIEVKLEKLERTGLGSAASKKSNTTLMSSSQTSGFGVDDSNLFAQSSRSQVDNRGIIV